MGIFFSFFTGEIGWSSGTTGSPPAGGTFDFIGGTDFQFIGGTYFDFI